MDNRCISLLMGNNETCHLHPPSDEISSDTHWRCLSRRCGMRIGFVAVSALRPLLKLMADHATEVNFLRGILLDPLLRTLTLFAQKRVHIRN